jgi:hypothetical protein
VTFEEQIYLWYVEMISYQIYRFQCTCTVIVHGSVLMFFNRKNDLYLEQLNLKKTRKIVSTLENANRVIMTE